MIFKGLHSIENPVYNRLSLDLGDCKLDVRAAEMIAKYMPKVERLTKVFLDKNGDFTFSSMCSYIRYLSREG